MITETKLRQAEYLLGKLNDCQDVGPLNNVFEQFRHHRCEYILQVLKQLGDGMFLAPGRGLPGMDQLSLGRFDSQLMYSLQCVGRRTFWFDRHWDSEDQELNGRLVQSYEAFVKGMSNGDLAYEDMAAFLCNVASLYDPFTFVCVDMLLEMDCDILPMIHHQGRYYRDLAKRVEELPVFVTDEPVTIGLPPRPFIGRMVFDGFQAAVSYLDGIHRIYMRGGNFASCQTSAVYAHNAYLRALRNILNADWSLSQ